MNRELVAFVEAWRVAAPELEAMRDRELTTVPVMDALEQLSGMIDSAVFLKPLVPDSGLVAMQEVFARLRK